MSFIFQEHPLRGNMITERGFSRAQCLSKEIQKAIAIILQQEIKDPYVKMATVSGVEVTHDLAYAKVFVTFLSILNKKHEIDLVKNGIKVLNTALVKYIRSLLGKAIPLRIVPELTFLYDSSLVEGIRMSNLISNAIREDETRRYNVQD